jgi:hypothetical protein
MTQVGPSGLIDTVPAPLWEGLDFPDLTRASDTGCDLSWFTTWHEDLWLFSPSLVYKWGFPTIQTTHGHDCKPFLAFPND